MVVLIYFQCFLWQSQGARDFGTLGAELQEDRYLIFSISQWCLALLHFTRLDQDRGS